jgi:hypothetical protein
MSVLSSVSAREQLGVLISFEYDELISVDARESDLEPDF